MSNLVRAKHPNGAEFTTSRAHAKRNNLTISEGEAVDQFGRIVPAKPRTDKGGTPDPITPDAKAPAKTKEQDK